MRCRAMMIAAGAALAAACTTPAPGEAPAGVEAADETERPASLMQWSDLLSRAMPQPSRSI